MEEEDLETASLSGMKNVAVTGRAEVSAEESISAQPPKSTDPISASMMLFS